MEEKESHYKEVALQLKGVWDEAIHIEGNLSNYCALLKHQFSFWWVGFYVVRNNELQLSVFQGPVACTRIPWGKGVCGTAWKEKVTQVVPNVHLFPGHIACSPISQSEIVVPLLLPNGEVWGVLDIDSEKLDNFNAIDKMELEKQCEQIVQYILKHAAA